MAHKKRIKRKSQIQRLQQQPTESKKAIKNAPKSSNHKIRLAHCIFLFILSCAIYFNTLDHGYVLDDSLFITGNDYTLAGLDGIKGIWTNDAFVGAHGQEFDLEGGRYRPLAITVFALVYEFFGLNPMVGHAMNIVLYGLSCILLYLLLLRLMPDKNEWVPLIAATLFTVHPVHTEVVANIKSIDELMSTFFVMLTLLFLFKKGRKGLIYSGVFYLLALLSKESSLTALALIPATLYFFTDLKVSKIVKRSLPFLAIAIAYLLWREQFSGGFGKGFEASNLMDSPYLHLGFADKLATITYVCGRYLLLLFWPHPLSWDYSYHEIPDAGWGDFSTLVSLAVYVGLIYFALRSLKNRSIIGYGILFYLFSFSIASNYLINIGTTMGERFIYLPSVGFSIAAAGLIVHLLKINTSDNFTYKPLWLAPLIIMIPLAGYATLDRNKAWKDNFTLYETDAPKVPNSARARMYYGVELNNKFNISGDRQLIDKAISELQASVAIYPEFYHAHEALAKAYQAADNHVEAFNQYQRVLQIAPRHINSTFQLGVTYARAKNDLPNAITWMEKGITVGYTGPDRFTSLANVYGMAGQFTKALENYNKELQVNPGNAQCFLNMGITYSLMGDSLQAGQYFEKAFAIDPSLRNQGSH